MENKIRYTLGKDERLKSRKAIDELFAAGKSFSLFPFKVVYRISSQPLTLNPETLNLQCAFSVSKRHFKKATERNRIKRLMREAWRLQKNDWQSSLQQSGQQVVVFLLYVGSELPPYGLVSEKIAAAIKKLQRITDEEAAGHL